MTTTAPRELSDWLSPMLIKELRQGTRGRIFVSSFLAFQGFMIFSVLLSLAGPSDPVDGVFWAVIGLTLLGVMPLRGLGAIGGEIRANTLELVFLTHLSALRIVAGKWFSLVAQSFLFLCAVLPYVIVRYFIGGNNIVDECATLALMFASGATFIAFTVGLSAFLTNWSRITVFLVLGGILGPILLSLMADWTLSGIGSASDEDFIAWFVLFAPLFLLLMLELGASRIAPPAENHSARKRGLALAFILAAVLLHFAGVDQLSMLMPFFAVVLFMSINAVVEEPVYIPAIALPFIRRGPIGRWVGRLLYPGWPSGILFSIVALGGSTLAAYACTGSTWTSDERAAALLLLVSLLGALWLPLAVTKAVAPRSSNSLINFLWIQLFFALLTLLVSIVDEVFRSVAPSYGFTQLLAVFPLCTALLTWFENRHVHDHTGWFLAMTSLTTAVSLLVLCWRAWPHYREIVRMERLAVRFLPAAAGRPGAEPDPPAAPGPAA